MTKQLLQRVLDVLERGEVPHALREVVDARKRFAAINAEEQSNG